MAGLTTKQREELNQAIHEYLVKHKYTQAAAMLQQESLMQPPQAQPLLKDMLERKWTSVAKLKKEVDDLTK